MKFWFGRWSGFYGWCGRWSVSNVVGCRCFVFLLVGGRFLFLRMVGGRCLNQYMVGGRWLMVGGWSAGGGFVLRPSTILAKFESHMRLIKSRNMEHNFDCTYQIIHNIG